MSANQQLAGFTHVNLLLLGSHLLSLGEHALRVYKELVICTQCELRMLPLEFDKLNPRLKDSARILV